MKSRILGLAALLAAALAAFSCQGTGPSGEDIIPVLKVPRETEAAAGGSQFVKVAAAGQWTLSVNYIVGDGWIHLSKTTDSGNASVDMTIDPNEVETPRKATLVLKTAKHEVSKEITQMGKVTAATSGWLELPAFEQKDGFFFGTHSMDGGAYVSQEKSGVRNWSFYYDYDAYVSWWVAYPLNSRLRGSGSRSDMWQATDPLLPAGAVCDISGGSYGGNSFSENTDTGGRGNWTRGHQIPSADRLDFNANVTTFYPTNMTPQDYNFNCEVWADLEDAVRNFARNSDTLYVVTGADVRNSTLRTKSYTNHAALVPTHYYKALLRKRGSDYSAIGYYLPHDMGYPASNYKVDYSNYVYSISELESLTGIDFFVNLPALLGADKAKEIEEASPSETLKNW
jgi:DNA/RNA endonuclease G (NUC1)